MRPIFLPYVSIADMLTQTFGSDCEVVLHDLNDPEHSVVYVSNGTVTGARPGDSFEPACAAGNPGPTGGRAIMRPIIISQPRTGSGYAPLPYSFGTRTDGWRARCASILTPRA